MCSVTERRILSPGYGLSGHGRRSIYNLTMSLVDAPERHEDFFEELLAQVATYNSNVDHELLARAFDFASRAHEGQERRSGEPFIHHPLGVAKICAELRLDDESIAAALLHDVVEDTDVGADEVRAEFGEEIANLVEGVTKLTRIQFQSREHAEAENYRKMIVAMAHDLRVILIKLSPTGCTTCGRSSISGARSRCRRLARRSRSTPRSPIGSVSTS